MLRAALLCSLSLMACAPVDECREIPAADLSTLPTTLGGSGLFATDAGVRAYEPRFELWSDGAKKRRWIRLPPGTQIDSSDPDSWQFPVGTRLWKEFVVDGKKVETRLIERGASEWIYAAYAWNTEQTEATLLPEGATNVLDTPHDVPAAAQCRGCHNGTASHVLGFSAVQLVDARALFAEGWLTNEPPEVVIPGTEIEQRALGYVHANCSHCHNQKRPSDGPERCWDPLQDFDFTLRTTELSSVSTTSAMRTRAPWNDALGRVRLVSSAGGMPPLAKDVVDPAGVAAIEAFVQTLR